MKSKNYKNWVAIIDLKTCKECRDNHGKIYVLGEFIDSMPPLHPNCRCEIEWLKAVAAGTATNQGEDGADFWLKWFGELPKYYITKQDADMLGYRSYLGNLSDVAPGRMLAKGVYQNRNGHLPSAPGRVWYEADINYYDGYRGGERVLYSNDGLVFVTYDHYRTFQEIVA